ncbi:hypothetical protein FB451DRAFT_1167606 [Mycena latifolia]|nr:hypothetical protein FB451DRAFT_1167606 [Mycena latifolia]
MHVGYSRPISPAEPNAVYVNSILASLNVRKVVLGKGDPEKSICSARSTGATDSTKTMPLTFMPGKPDMGSHDIREDDEANLKRLPKMVSVYIRRICMSFCLYDIKRRQNCMDTIANLVFQNPGIWRVFRFGLGSELNPAKDVLLSPGGHTHMADSRLLSSQGLTARIQNSDSYIACP